MAKDEVQQHLDKGRYGSPRINPEEQRKYLGTFRERCFVSMTVSEMRSKQDQKNLIEEIKQHPDGKLLINGAVSEELQRTFIGLASKNAADFTIVNDATVESEESIGLLLVTDYAVNEETIDIEAKYPPKSEDEEEPKEKKSFFSRFFD
ncbi:YueI family protein [Enterococcus dongliensis]|uniref:YueI family protein n=1 Tax=Enterococcus dongliensis TaxID=2559925 RepID=A0AAP5U196_9ENTE|nr:YueI family protein [Enterococcus dongliensis]MDT2596038.1 YueI family protein [Enterococcus dongliensis]MDT2603480.1 YueI family protein [Enterococcus dongliensis]MDT2613311.1 YueI family protein [Enterococcus dongliensis]MDT2634375.1 YueI family protein [Enterococcus dongliensis]MDT2636892.1 YueI family protein [Enterococcus dongliensis]